MAGSSAGSIFVDLLLQDAKYRDGLRRARNSTKSFSVDVVSSLKTVAASLTAAFSVREIGRLSDQYKQIEGRLKLVTNSSEQLANVQERLFDIAQSTRTDLGATVTLYQRLSSATKGLGVSQAEIFTFTEQLNKQLITAGVASTEAASAILQLTQAFNKGKLDGDEFRSILENAPPILEALTKSLGVTRGEIYKLAKDGQLGPRVLIDAVNGMADVTNARFKDFEMTIGQAFTQLNNSILTFVGNSSLVDGASRLIAQGISRISDVLGEASKESNIFITAISKLGESIYGYIAAYNELHLAVAQKTNVFGIRDDDILKYQQNIDKAVASANKLRDALKDYNNQGKGTGSGEVPTDPLVPEKPKIDTKAIEKQMREIQSIYERHRGIILGVDNATLRYNDTIEDLNKLLAAGKISQDEFNGAVIRAQEELEKASDKGKLFAFDIEAASKRAAENIQDTFADFLFDPFAKGLDGMLQGFADTLRRMAAEALSAQILGNIFGSGGSASGFLGNIFGGIAGARANGGPVSGGSTYLVGERGPELFRPNATGTIIPNHALPTGGASVSVNIINNSNSQVSTRQGTNGATLDVLIDQAVAQNISMPGSRTNQALSNFNSRGLVRR